METANNLKDHEKTYGSFVGLLKWAVPVLFILTFLVILLIS